MIEQMKVASTSSPSAVAGAISSIFRSQDQLDIDTVGAGALNQAIKAIAIARGFLVPSGIDLVLSPSFKEIQIEGKEKTAVRLHIKKSK